METITIKYNVLRTLIETLVVLGIINLLLQIKIKGKTFLEILESRSRLVYILLLLISVIIGAFILTGSSMYSSLFLYWPWLIPVSIFLLVYALYQLFIWYLDSHDIQFDVQVNYFRKALTTFLAFVINWLPSKKIVFNLALENLMDNLIRFDLENKFEKEILVGLKKLGTLKSKDLYDLAKRFQYKVYYADFSQKPLPEEMLKEGGIELDEGYIAPFPVDSTYVNQFYGMVNMAASHSLKEQKNGF